MEEITLKTLKDLLYVFNNYKIKVFYNDIAEIDTDNMTSFKNNTLFNDYIILSICVFDGWIYISVEKKKRLNKIAFFHFFAFAFAWFFFIIDIKDFKRRKQYLK